MRWKMTQAAELKRVAIFVSKADHALQELLWRAHSGELNADIRMVISNHPDLAETVGGWDIPFHHVPVSRETQGPRPRRAQLKLLAAEDVDVVVLARYMQILSPAFPRRMPAGRSSTSTTASCRRSPAPTRTRPPPTAGVKLIGATAHYVTAELDAGPIIEQDIVRVDHRYTVDRAAQARPARGAVRAGPRGRLASGRPGHRPPEQDDRLRVTGSSAAGGCSARPGVQLDYGQSSR